MLLLAGGLLGAALLQRDLRPSDLLQVALLFTAGMLVHRWLGADRFKLAQQMPQLESLQDLLGNIAVVGAGLLLVLQWQELPQ